MALVTVQLKCCNLSEIFRKLSIEFLRVLLDKYNLRGQWSRLTSKFTNRTISANRIFEKIAVAMD